MNKLKITLRTFRIIFYIIFFITFILLPLDKVDNKSLCFTYNLTGALCPTCGVTRSFTHLMHLDFINAYKFNPIFLLVIFPICFIIIIQDSYIIIKDIITKKESYSMLEYLLKL